MFYHYLLEVILAATLLLSSPLLSADPINLNEVGKKVAVMLQNRHYSNIKFNSELGNKFLQNYLSSLDRDHIYFTQVDVDDLTLKYSKRLHSMILEGASSEVAKDIFIRYKARLNEMMVSYEKNLCSRINLSTNETAIINRKHENWPKDQTDLEKAWIANVKKSLIDKFLIKMSLIEKPDDIDAMVSESLLNEVSNELLFEVRRNYLNTVNAEPNQIANLFLNSLVKVYDPHSDYMTNGESDQYSDILKAETIGIGIEIHKDVDGSIRVNNVIKNTSADLSKNIKINDRLLGIDTLNAGTEETMLSLDGLDLSTVIELLRGKENTSLALKVERSDLRAIQLKTVVLTRTKIRLVSEQASGVIIKLKNYSNDHYKIGFITLPSFYTDFNLGEIRSSLDVEKILLKMMDENIDGLIFDIRHNSGGSLEEAKKITSLFINNGPIVQVKDNLGRIQVKYHDNNKALYTGPLVIMTDIYSASASEIVAGALQDYNRAVIVGDESTFGKGSIQQSMDIGRELPLFATREKAGSLKLTIQKFYRPSGKSTQIEGVKSDLILPNINDGIQLGERALPHSLPCDRIHPADGFQPLDKDILFLTQLKSLSSERINQSKEFSIVKNKSSNHKNILSNNLISLNLNTRLAEMCVKTSSARLSDKEMLFQLSVFVENNSKLWTFLEVPSDSVNQKNAYEDLGSFSKREQLSSRSNSFLSDFGFTVPYPRLLDPAEREVMEIMKNLIDLTEREKVAKHNN
jgi:carboxyl-terminal processing protease